MKIFIYLSTITAAIAISATSAQAGFLDSLGFGKSSTNSTALGSLSQDQMVGGLKDALGNGVQHAISELGHDGGFLTNVAVRIPVPEKLQSVEKAARAMGQGALVDQFEATMNHAAEQAVPAAASVFGDAVKNMSIDDARAILTGPDDSATQYFKRTTATNLYALFLPIVQKATSANGVTSSYKQLTDKVNGAGGSGGMFGNLGGVANKYMGSDALDLDAYVTNKSLDGLFTMIAEEEKNIRQNPVARTTDLMKTVFGAVSSGK
jgi:hypothetical protein